MPRSVQKGKAGEVEFCKWLKKHFNIDAERNYNQSWGGADITIEDFVFEIKRRENLDLNSWWYQVAIARKKHEQKEGRPLVPVVAFRQNRKPWRFLIPAGFIGVELGYIELSEKVFIEFMGNFMKGIGVDYLKERW